MILFGRWRATQWFFPIHRRSRMWLLVASCQFIVATALVSTLLISERMQDGFTLKAAEFIAADVRIGHPELKVEALRDLARQEQLDFSSSRVMLTSVLTEDEDLHLVSLKAIDSQYPLRGDLVLEGEEGLTVSRPPQPGQVWVDAILRSRGLLLGQKLRVGDLWMEIGAFIVREPERGLIGPGMAARVMISHQELDRSGLIRLGTRLSKQVMLAGERAKLDRYVEQAVLPENVKPIYAREGRPDVREVIDNLSLFVNLAGFVAMLFAAVILYLALQLLATEERRTQWLLWNWGYGLAQRHLWFWARILAVAIIANTLGIMAAVLIQEIFTVSYLNQIFVDLPPLDGDGLWLVTQLSIVILPVAALSLWQSVQQPWLNTHNQGYMAHVWSWLLLAILIGWYFANRIDNIYLLSGLVSSVSLGALLYYLFVRVCLARFFPQSAFWSLLKNNLSTRPRLSFLYVCALSVVMMIAMIVFLLRAGMLVTVEESLANDSPNHYLLSIQPNETEPLGLRLTELLALSDQPDFYPIVRARVIRVNGEEIEIGGVSRIGQARLLREWGLSYLPAPVNELIEGSWFSPEAPKAGQSDNAAVPTYTPQWSVSTEVIDSLDAKLGDELTFRISGSGEYSAPIASIRKVKWGTIKPNFFVLASPGLLNAEPKTYITALRLNENQGLVLNQVVKDFPGLTHLDLNLIIDRFRELLNIFVELLWVILLYTTVLALVAVACILQFGVETTRRESALLRSFGVSAKLMYRVRLMENLILSILAVLPASLIAGASSYYFYTSLLDLSSFWPLLNNLWMLSLSSIAVIVALTAFMQKFLTEKNTKALRSADDYHS